MHSDSKTIPLVYTSALALSAVLLFWVQPMIAKMVLSRRPPTLIWNWLLLKYISRYCGSVIPLPGSCSQKTNEHSAKLRQTSSGVR